MKIENMYEKLEPNVECNDLDYDNEIQLSIAISLKRIADKLELSQKQPVVMTAEEAVKYNREFFTYDGTYKKV